MLGAGLLDVNGKVNDMLQRRHAVSGTTTPWHKSGASSTTENPISSLYLKASSKLEAVEAASDNAPQRRPRTVPEVSVCASACLLAAAGVDLLSLADAAI
jgi:hypothetical protein